MNDQATLAVLGAQLRAVAIVGREVARAETKAQVMAMTMTATVEGESVGANMAAALETAYGVEVVSRTRATNKYLQHARSSLLSGSLPEEIRDLSLLKLAEGSTDGGGVSETLGPFNLKYKPTRPHTIESTSTFLQLFYIWNRAMVAAWSVLVEAQTGGRHGALGTRCVLPDGASVHV